MQLVNILRCYRRSAFNLISLLALTVRTKKSQCGTLEVAQPKTYVDYAQNVSNLTHNKTVEEKQLLTNVLFTIEFHIVVEVLYFRCASIFHCRSSSNSIEHVM